MEHARGSQLFYILGIDMAGVLIATCMQPSIPVITACLGVVLGLEAGSMSKFLGILTAVAGSICMVLPPSHTYLIAGLSRTYKRP